MKKNLNLLLIIPFALLFTLFFYRQGAGINLVIYSSLVLAYFLLTRRINCKTTLNRIVITGFTTTLLATLLVHSLFAHFIHLISFALLVGLAVFPETKSLFVTSLFVALHSIRAQFGLFSELESARASGQKISRYLRLSLAFIIPVLIILVFITIYRASNPLFNKLMFHFDDFLNSTLMAWLTNMDAELVILTVFGLLISNFIFIRTQNPLLSSWNQVSKDELERKRMSRYSNFPMLALKNEYRAAIFLFLALNLVLLVVNIIDINWVWFHFSWQGEYLKQFVHEGTYLLILSILLSMALVLFFFRRNLHFYSNNRWLKWLSYSWLAQNAILAVSVGIRNYWYIHYFALAYKRIGVVLFLLFTLYGLYTVYLKVRDRKSAFYLLRANTLSLYILLTIGSLFPWDNLIARYNFSHAGRSFVHLDFLSGLSDATLPRLDKSLDELKTIQAQQRQKFPFESQCLSPEDYYSRINDRKQRFLTQYPQRTLFEWNLPDYLAYRSLKSSN